MTIFEHIKSMSIEQLAEYLKDGFDCCDCSEHQRLSDNPLLKDERCDQKCAKHCKEWLESEADNE